MTSGIVQILCLDCDINKAHISKILKILLLFKTPSGIAFVTDLTIPLLN